MPHIHHGHGEHDHTASAYIIRTDHAEPAVMLHLHRKLGRYFQFGGHIELNETPWQAVIREITEESGYLPEQLQVLQPPGMLEMANTPGLVRHPYPVDYNTHQFKDDTHFHTDTAYAFVASAPPAQSPEETESQDIQLFTLDQLAHPNVELLVPYTISVASYILKVAYVDWKRVSLSKWVR